MPQSRIEIYDTPKLQYRVCFHAVPRGYIVTVPALQELAVFGTNIKHARIAAATAIEALTEDLEANDVPVAKRDPLAVSMTENIERMIRMLSGRPELMEWLDRQRSLYAVSAYAPNGEDRGIRQSARLTVIRYRPKDTASLGDRVAKTTRVTDRRPSIRPLPRSSRTWP